MIVRVWWKACMHTNVDRAMRPMIEVRSISIKGDCIVVLERRLDQTNFGNTLNEYLLFE